jgi:hypothetical protein
MEDLTLWTEADWQKACKYGFTVFGGLVGGAFGGLASTPSAGAAAALTVPAGAAYGAAIGLTTGLLLCPRISKEKAEQFLSGAPMSKADAGRVLSALADVSAARSKDEVLQLAALLRTAHRLGVADPKASIGRTTPIACAHSLLAQSRFTRT